MSFFELPGSKPIYQVKVEARKVVGHHLVASVTLYFLSEPTVKSVCQSIVDEFKASEKGHDEFFPWTNAERRSHQAGARECIKVVRSAGIPKLSKGAASVHIIHDKGVKGLRPKGKRGKRDFAKMPRISVTRTWAKP